MSARCRLCFCFLPLAPLALGCLSRPLASVFFFPCFLGPSGFRFFSGRFCVAAWPWLAWVPFGTRFVSALAVALSFFSLPLPVLSPLGGDPGCPPPPLPSARALPLTPITLLGLRCVCLCRRHLPTAIPHRDLEVHQGVKPSPMANLAGPPLCWWCGEGGYLSRLAKRKCV